MKNQIFLMSGLLALQLGCSKSEKAFVQTAEKAQPVAVQVMTAQVSSVDEPYELSGTVHARQKVVVTSKLSGTVTSVEVNMGDHVRSGQRLLTIDDRGPSIELAAAQAAIDAAGRGREQAEKAVVAAEADARLASATLQRIQQLFDKRSASQQELDQAKARAQAAQAAVEMARGRVAEAQAHERGAAAASEGAQLRLSYTRIDSSLDGYVIARSIDPGAVVAPGMPLLELEQGRDYRLEMSMPESQLRNIKVGSEVAVEVPSIDLRTKGRVIEIEPATEPGSRSSMVRIQLPVNDRLRSGLFGQATVTSGKRDVLALPEEVIIRQGQLTSVFLNDNGMARRRLITLGKQYPGGREVLSGLRAGEQVIISDLAQLNDGSPVEIAR